MKESDITAAWAVHARGRALNEMAVPSDFFGCNLSDEVVAGVAVPIMDSIVGLKAANAHLVRQLAAQALAHAEHMEGARQALKKLRDDIGFWIEAHGAKKLRVAELESENSKLTLALAGQNIHAQQIAMRVMVATPPTDSQQTASDVKAAPERRPDGTLKPVARAWEAPRRLNDGRRVGG